MAIKVTLRRKPISGNRESLYLDFYPAISHPVTGKNTRREFLGFFVFSEFENLDSGKRKKVSLSPLDKQHNKNTIQLAEQIRQRRDNEVNKPEVYTEFERGQLKAQKLASGDFVAYFKKLCEKRSASNYDNWTSTLHYLQAFTKGALKFSEIDLAFCTDFADYLMATKSRKSKKIGLSQNSASSYYNKFKAALKQSFKDGLLQSDLNSKIPSIRPIDTLRSYLTLEELNKLVVTECLNPILKRAALFSSLTGMRFSDIQKMTWDEVEEIEGSGVVIKFRQKKTGAAEVLPISDQAFSLMGIRRESFKPVFSELKYSAYENKNLHHWVSAAGIKKHITFHCFRHTYATLQLNGGTDIYTVSKLLGHRELKTTQIYAKVIDQSKRNAVDKIRLTF